MAKYLHEPNKNYDTNYGTADDWNRNANKVREHQLHIEQIKHRSMQRSRLQTRKTEREILQTASSQGLSPKAEISLSEAISTTNPQLATEYLLKKSVTFKDPTKLNDTNSVN